MFWILDWNLNSFCVSCFGFGSELEFEKLMIIRLSRVENFKFRNRKGFRASAMNKHGHPSRDLAQDYTAADSTQDYTAADLSVFGSIPVEYPLNGQPIRYHLDSLDCVHAPIGTRSLRNVHLLRSTRFGLT